MNGKMNCVLPAIQVVPPSSSESFLIAAEELLSGLEVLEANLRQTTLACAFLSAQSLECALKSFLSHSGMSDERLKRMNHNLEKLWRKSVSRGLNLQSDPPQWCVILNSGHNAPYLFRYPIGLNGFVFPALTTLISELRSTISTVEESIH